MNYQTWLENVYMVFVHVIDISEIMEDIWQKNITGLNFTLYQEKQTSHHIQSDVLLKKFQVFSILIKNRQRRQLAILIKIIFLMYFEMF